MKKYILVTLVMIGLVGGLYLARYTGSHVLCKGNLTVSSRFTLNELSQKESSPLEEGMMLLKSRRDKEALIAIDKALSEDPANLQALWAKAELLRRSRKYQESEIILNEVLKKDPVYVPAILTLSYIKYKEDKINESQELVKQVLKMKTLNNEEKALAYMMIGAINSRSISDSWILKKVIHGLQVKASFDKAVRLAPDLPEVHLAVGTFYLKAPAIIGGNTVRAIRELETATRIAPDFAEANARLAQAYKKNGKIREYNFYIKRAKELDPENEVLKEL